jgi:sigma-B regulation protein RsbU (phosphoserine phosphatase)
MAVGLLLCTQALRPRRKFGQELTRRLDGFVETYASRSIITAALLYVDLGEGTLTIQNCGHTPIYLFIPGEDRRVVGKTMPANMAPLGMGVVSSEENTAYRVPISRGLRVVSYTDGLTDMVDPDGERYGDDRARDLIAGTYGKSEAETRAAFSKAIDGWVSDALQADDITISISASCSAEGPACAIVVSWRQIPVC